MVDNLMLRVEHFLCAAAFREAELQGMSERVSKPTSDGLDLFKDRKGVGAYLSIFSSG